MILTSKGLGTTEPGRALVDHAGIAGPERGGEAGAAVDTDDLDPVGRQPASPQIGEDGLTLGGALASGQAKVDAPLPSCGFRRMSATRSDLISATDSDLKSATL